MLGVVHSDGGRIIFFPARNNSLESKYALLHLVSPSMRVSSCGTPKAPNGGD